MIKLATRKQDAITILDLQGTIDLDGVTTLKEAVSSGRKAGCQKMIVNMSNVDNIVSTVLYSLQATVTAFWVSNGKLILTNVSNDNLRVLQKEPFFKMMSVAESEAEAIQRLGG